MEWGMRRRKKRGEKGAKNDLHFSCSYIAKRSSLNLLPIKLIFKLRKEEFASYWMYSREKSCVVWIDHAACIGKKWCSKVHEVVHRLYENLLCATLKCRLDFNRL